MQKSMPQINVRRKTVLEKMKGELRENGALFILALPGIIALLMFNYLPMFGLVIVFKAYNFKDGILGSPWVGLKNFEFFFSDIGNAWRATSNTIILNVFYIVIGTIVAVAVAVMVNELKNERFKKTSQSIMFFPYFLSWVALGSILYMFLDDKGILNSVLQTFGLSPVSWNLEPRYWKPILVLCYLWKNTGYTSIVYFAALTGFDPALYEAAGMDGASRTQQIFKITIPLLLPTIVTMFLLSIGRILNGDLGMIMGLTNLNPLLLPATDIIETYVYRSAIKGGQFEMASAVALYQSVFGFVLVLFSNWIAGRFDKEYKLF